WAAGEGRQANDERAGGCRTAPGAPPGRAGRVAAAVVGDAVLLLPAVRLLRAAPGARRHGRVLGRRRGVSTRPDRARRAHGHRARRIHPAAAVHRHLHHDGAAAAAVWRAGLALPAAGVPARGVPALHRLPARLLVGLRQPHPGARGGVLRVGGGVQPVRRDGVLELHGGRVRQRERQAVLRLHRRRRHHRRVATLLVVPAAFFAVCLFCIMRLRPWAQARERAHGGGTDGRAMGGSMLAGLRLVWERPLLRALALLMFFGVGVGTLLYTEQA